jgi:hypothetical protein
LSTAFARYARHRIFSKKTTFADGLCQGLSAQVFSKKKVVGKDDFKNRQLNPPLRLLVFADGPLWAFGTAFAESLELRCSAKSCDREKILREPCAERDRRQSLCQAYPALGKAPISSSGV